MEALDQDDQGQMRGSYKFINNDCRYKLLLYTEIMQWNVVEACKKLEIKYTTAKSVLNMFHKTGRIHRMQRTKFDVDHFKEVQDSKQKLQI
jgi:hypothetical protein